MAVSPWSVMKSGDADQAIRMMREAYEQMPDASHIMELGVGYLWVKNYQAAWEHFYDVNQKDPNHHAIFYGMAGVAKWCMNEPEESVRQWCSGLNCRYADGAGGVQLPLLLFDASVFKPEVYPRAEAEKLLTVRANDRRVKNWPGPVAEFLLGRIDEGGLRSKCAGLNEGDTFMRHWLADFYIGILEHTHGNMQCFQKMIHKTAETSDDDFDSTKKQYLGKVWDAEFFIAYHESFGDRDMIKET